MGTIKIYNCNNILEGQLEIEEGKLNIKYGSNGTGKSTIAHAIAYNSNGQIDSLTPFGTGLKPKVESDLHFGKIALFDEDFLNNMVFQEDDLIKDSFEIILNINGYSNKKEKLDELLKQVQDYVNSEAIIELYNNISLILDKFNLSKNNKLVKTKTYKSLLSKNNIYNVPDGLKKFNQWFQNKDQVIEWIAWKNQGLVFDDYKECPYCGNDANLNRQEESNIFSEIYKKKDSEYLKSFIEDIQKISKFIKNDKFAELIGIIDESTSNARTEELIEHLYFELIDVKNKIDSIRSFGQNDLLAINLREINERIEEMIINSDTKIILGGNTYSRRINKLNGFIKELREQTNILRQQLGMVRNVLNTAINKSQTDINSFLEVAGIDYEIYIDTEDHINKTYLRFKGQNSYNITNVKKHLSYGERNAISMILFMYYAYEQNPDLIVLDDPISSFDSNKKYAILHRMFKLKPEGNATFKNKTVLLLTHDFEPIIDFIKVGKLRSDQVIASYICNYDNILKEQKINCEDIILTTGEYTKLAKDTNINIASRIAFTRKLTEIYMADNYDYNLAYQVLSCIIHKNSMRIKLGENEFVEMTEDQIEIAVSIINQYINDFTIEELQDQMTKENLLNMYSQEQNNYFKLQIFRLLCEILDSNDKILHDKSENQRNEAWYKYVDETFHIGDEYMYYLDLKKFDIVPRFIIDKIGSLLA